MSRTGWGSANFLRYSGAVVSAYPCSLAIWFYTTATALNKLIGVFDSTVSLNNGQISVGINAAGAVSARSGQTSGSNVADTTTTYSLNTWQHACGVFASTSSRAAYLNGGGKGTNAAVINFPSANRTSMGRRDNSSGDQAFDTNGMLAEGAAWNVALTDTDVAKLAGGVSPLLIRPEGLVGYWPVIGAYSPEIELRGRQEMAIQGSLSAAAHPAVFYPRRRQRGFLPAAAIPPAAVQPRLAMMGVGA